ncbi:alkaline phosphatase [Kribbella sandramycini]|uniref:Alkaline phosphatase n=1 Tax=Kribbella sandramycini TaxID=60450 RepID=A0A7Y4NXF7_9ACTN|nr:discoidin domain-containing protein [Kribbella sandramycini]MBB6567554.1 ribose 5-phosphate isomerase RpiB [Kribbella sandramycini]NOL39842.1 alkaline phosphatase [Kribbella sandramycini]
MSKRMRRWSALLPMVLVAVAGGSAAIAGTQADSLLSQGKPALASSIEDSTFTADKAFDGSTSTRWASTEGVDPQWIRVDLGQQAEIHRVKLTWEAAYGKDYRIEVSNDGTTFSTVKSLTNQNGGTDDITGLSGTGRYVRIVGTKRGTAYGYSLFEAQVYGEGSSTGDTQAPTVPTGLASTGVTATTAGLSWTASTDNVGVTGYDVLRNGTQVATSETTSYTDTGLTGDTTYSYTVRARDLAGNVSGASTALSVKTSAGTGGGGFVLAAAGDIAKQCTASDSSCIHPKTAKLIETIKPANIITMGDNQYDDAHLSDFQNYFDKTWGKYKSIMKPSPGNHESYDSPAFSGYEKYFGAIAKPNGKRYYSWEKGNWHFVALDSNDFATSEKLAEPAQMTWLKADLAANTKPCVVTYYHHPRWSTGERGDNPDGVDLWKVMTDNKVDLVLTGHDHHYERFFPVNNSGSVDQTNGTVQIIGGMAGASPYKLGPAKSRTAKRMVSYGVLKLTMTENSWTSQLIGLNNEVLDSSPTYTCKAKG